MTSPDFEELKKKFIIKDNLYDFNVMSNFIPKFFELLWENPKIVSDMIIHCNLLDIKEKLAKFFMNNFYENILSGNSIENNLIYVLTLLIKDEIDKLNNIEDCDKFLDKDSKVGYLLSELRKKKDIKNYFKTFIPNLISDLESISLRKLCLNFKEMFDKLKRKNSHYKNVPIDNDNLDQIKSKIITEKKELDKLVAKYLSTLTITDLKNMISKSNSTNSDINSYINNYINNSKDELYYSNLKLMEKFDLKEKLSNKLIFIYINKFNLIKDFIDRFISILKKNIILLPYSVKCFCKIINILIQKKFPDINVAHKNAFISQFFFKKIIKPILSDPGIELLINNFIISGNTIPNLNIINGILNKLFSGKLFVDNNYTPFNWYFLEKIPDIIEIFSKLIDVELPDFIDELINDKLDSNFIYDYSKLNEDEKIIHSSICFNFQDLTAVLDGISQLSSKVDICQYKEGNYLLKTFEKLNSEKSREALESLYHKINVTSFFITRKGSKKRNNSSLLIDKDKEINNDAQKELIEIKNENYYLIQKIMINKEYKELFKIKSDSKKNFYIKEIKTSTNSPEINSKNAIIKMKNFLSDLLYNIFPLNKFKFSKSNINNTKDILNSIKKYSKISNYILDNSIPLEWYIESILNLIKNISEDYSKNDFEKLYDELEKEIETSINGYNIEFQTEFTYRLKYIEKEKLYYKQFFKELNDLELNQKVKDIVENDFIPIILTFNYEDKNKCFNIAKSNIKIEDFLKKESKENTGHNSLYKRYCKSIKSFIENFPDFSVFKEKHNIDILELQTSLSVPKILKEYFFSIIREHLSTEYNEEIKINLIQIENKIYDYAMSKIYTKIFPKTHVNDDKISKKIFMLSWTEPKHFIQGRDNYIFDAFLPEVIDNFKSIDNQHSPRIKILFLDKIFELITKIVSFNGGNTNLGVDDQMPILNYCIVKAQPNRIYSNIKFMELYRNSLIEKGNPNELVQMIASFEFIKNIDYNNLNGVSQEEFIKNCDAIFGEVDSF